jgi:hypothetical protein
MPSDQFYKSPLWRRLCAAVLALICSKGDQRVFFTNERSCENRNCLAKIATTIVLEPRLGLHERSQRELRKMADVARQMDRSETKVEGTTVLPRLEGFMPVRVNGKLWLYARDEYERAVATGKLPPSAGYQ